MTIVPGTTRDQRAQFVKMLDELYDLPEGKTHDEVQQEAKAECMQQVSNIVQNNHNVLATNLSGHTNTLMSLYQRAQDELALLRTIESNIVAEPTTEENFKNIQRVLAELKALRLSWMPEVDPSTETVTLEDKEHV